MKNLNLKTQKINNFIEFQNRLFPDGNIPTREEIKQLVLNGDTSIKTHILNKMYRLQVFRYDVLDETCRYNLYARV